mgnify:CR=1 FL=1
MKINALNPAAPALRVLLVDDDLVSLRLIEHACQKLAEVEVVGTARSGSEALEKFSSAHLDLIISDVSMPGLNGIELTNSLYPRPFMILMSGSEEFAVDAFGVDAVDFLVKPLSLPRLNQALQRVRAAREQAQPFSGQEHFFIKTNRKLMRLDLNQVRYVEAAGDYVTFDLTHGQYVVHTTLKQLEEHIHHPDWVRVHRSFLVNLSYVVDIEDGTLVVANRVIPISRSNRPHLLGRIHTIG